VIYITKNGEKIGTLTKSPRSPILPSDFGIFKFDNGFLYTKDFAITYLSILSDIGLQPIRVNRLDMCVDFVKFANNLSPFTFLKRFNSSIYVDSKRHSYREFGQTGNGKFVETLRLGSPSSPISVYLYNKTKEMQIKGEKLHILKFWNENGLGLEKTVWRLEVSISGNDLKDLEITSGEFRDIDFNKIGDMAYIKKIYFASINQHFNFKDSRTHSRKDRMKKVELFKITDELNTKLTRIKNDESPTRTHKLTLKTLVRHAQELKKIESEITANMIDVIEQFAASKQLVKYLIEKTDFLTLK